MPRCYSNTLSVLILLLSICTARADGTVTYNGTLQNFSYSGDTVADTGFMNVVFSSCSQNCGTYSLSISETDVTDPHNPFQINQRYVATIHLSNGEMDTVSGNSVGTLMGFNGGFNDDAWSVNTTSWFHYINEGYVGGKFYPDVNFDASFTPNAVPEPSVWAMMLIGLAGLSVLGRRQSYQVACVSKT